MDSNKILIGSLANIKLTIDTWSVCASVLQRNWHKRGGPKQQ